MRIDILSLPGNSIVEKLTFHIQQSADMGKRFNLLGPAGFMPTEPERGDDTNKLKALSEAIKQTADLYRCKRQPLYKAKKYAGPSLRELAKANGSVVGEVYSIEHLQVICSQSGFDSKTYATQSTDEYVNLLQILVDRNLAPMVFFNVVLDGSERHGLPMIGNGQNEHAAVVIGYYKNEEDETRFLITQWNKCYDVDGMELALSACHGLSDRSISKTFNTYWDPRTNQTLWTSRAPRPDLYVKINSTRYSNEQQFESGTSFRGKILVVTKPLRLRYEIDFRLFSAKPCQERLEDKNLLVSRTLNT